MDWPTGEVHGHTTITSVKRAPAMWQTDGAHVYIGMPGYAAQTTGYFGKPWECLRDPRGWRVAYRDYLVHRIENDPVFAGAVLALHGYTLVCFCKHKHQGHGADQWCHGDLLATAAERLFHALP
jgi:Domain of unknown function (DUF4326)